jgi:recombination protein RecT
MSAVTAEKPENPIAVVRHQLDGMQEQFKAALPVHIPVERFARVVMTAIQQQPDLLAVERRSLWNAAMRAAQDGLLPDGREGALVIFNDRQRGKVAQWMPMIAGIRKKVRNSGEIATWECHVVHQNDEFAFELGDSPFIRHKPVLTGDPGPVIAAYSVAQLKTGELSREVMTIAEILKVREASRAKDSPWVDWFDEMARKTVARRHAKVLPMSTDMDDLLRRDDDLYDFRKARDEAQQPRLHSLTDKLDAIAKLPEPTAAEPAPEAPQMPTDAAAAPEAPDEALDEPTRPVEPLMVGKARIRGREDRKGGYKRISKWKTDSEETRAYFEGYDEEPVPA